MSLNASKRRLTEQINASDDGGETVEKIYEYLFLSLLAKPWHTLLLHANTLILSVSRRTIMR